MEVPDEFQRLIRPRCRFIGAGDFDPDAPLSAMGVDSLEVVDLIIEIEDSYGIEVPQELLTPEVFTSTVTIWLALRGLIGERGEPAVAGS
jgi:acyl carrier protein